MDGQAEQAPIANDDVVQFLLDNPSADSDEAEITQEDEQTVDSPESDDVIETLDSESDEDNEDAETEDDSPGEDEPDRTSGQKFKVTIKGSDGADEEIEVDQKELIAGYQRHSRFTQEMQALSQREQKAAEIVQNEISKAQQHYVQQAQMAHAIVAQLAGLRSPAEMHQLAQTDPAGYVAEQARQDQMRSILGSLQQGWQEESAKAQRMQQAALKNSYAKCWEVLQEKGIDRKGLEGIFNGFAKEYNIAPERFAGVSDPALVLAMQDAVAYRQLKQKTAEAKRKPVAAAQVSKPNAAPRGVSSAERKATERLRSGKGSRDDLAAFIMKHNL